MSRTAYPVAGVLSLAGLAEVTVPHGAVEMVDALTRLLIYAGVLVIALEKLYRLHLSRRDAMKRTGGDALLRRHQHGPAVAAAFLAAALFAGNVTASPGASAMIVASPYHDANLSLPIRGGDAGIWDTLSVMAACVDDAVASGGPVHRIAQALATDWGNDRARQLYGVYDYLRQAMVFKPDPRFMEHVRHPDQIAEEMLLDDATSGDCDDRASIGAALVKLMGFRPVLIVASVRPGGEFHHVLFGVALDGRGVVPLDPQEGFFARWPKGLTRKQVFIWPGPLVQPAYANVSNWLADVRARRAGQLGGLVPTLTRWT